MFLQVLTGKLAHSMQIKRVLWSYLQDFFIACRCPEHVHMQRCITLQGKAELLGSSQHCPSVSPGFVEALIQL